MYGWLLKRGDKGPLKIWRRRWFTNEYFSDRLLFYTVNPSDDQIRGYIDISKIEDIAIASEESGTFMIRVGARTYWLRSGDARSMYSWIDAFNRVSGYGHTHEIRDTNPPDSCISLAC
eukprot:TRINITY_DN5752_c0_g1::TRINITY_DN5752_c0_g1_i1::g.14542::m.14542 TRINITY_DN5752_c0_g1::TRINITY_DN5752_c0_g1_i1::g.14542  ORF type:complete len:118 (-),score=5.65,sp/B1AVH7/TBD2A_MOUSE/33.71/8e-08,PH_8/PF15409.1/1.8e-09,PH/PF00169.24/2.3e-08,PH_11/PF15413.1/0.00028,PH_3/PF14593.1/0.00046 TRINITY_DN5752_c0_g1_i1:253-606(-)